MAGLGMNVIAVLHQPRFSIFALFDDIMLLGKGGRLVYLGPSWLAMPYFESLDFELPLHENPADFVMDVISGSVPQRGSDAFHPERLVGLWQTYGLSWVRTQSKLMPLGERKGGVGEGGRSFGGGRGVKEGSCFYSPCCNPLVAP